MTACNATRRGFTLVEISVALAISGLVLLTARVLVGGLLDGSQQVLAGQRAAAADAHGKRLLLVAVAGIDVAGPGAAEFRGTADSFTCSSWLRSAGGGWELRRIHVAARDDTLWVGGRAVAPGVASLQLDYLLTPGAGATWARGWVSSTTPPLALRFRLARAARTDTLLLLVGERT